MLEWVAISFFKGSSWPRDQTQVSHIVGNRFTVWATRELILIPGWTFHYHQYLKYLLRSIMVKVFFVVIFLILLLITHVTDTPRVFLWRVSKSISAIRFLILKWAISLVVISGSFQSEKEFRVWNWNDKFPLPLIFKLMYTRNTVLHVFWTKRKFCSKLKVSLWWMSKLFSCCPSSYFTKDVPL